MGFASSDLEWKGATTDELTFMRAVYDRCVEIAQSKKLKFVNDLPNSSLGKIDNKKKLVEVAAARCNDLIAALRKAAQSEEMNITATIASGYRPATRQFELWRNHFNGYYNDTRKHRAKAVGGEHGSAAISWMADYVRGKTATPGYSNHQNGLAVDFFVIEKGTVHKADSHEESLKAWKSTWFWGWMNANANSFGFFQNKKIDEPWHWEYKVGKEPESQEPERIRADGPTALV